MDHTKTNFVYDRTIEDFDTYTVDDSVSNAEISMTFENLNNCYLELTDRIMEIDVQRRYLSLYLRKLSAISFERDSRNKAQQTLQNPDDIDLNSSKDDSEDEKIQKPKTKPKAKAKAKTVAKTAAKTATTATTKTATKPIVPIVPVESGSDEDNVPKPDIAGSSSSSDAEPPKPKARAKPKTKLDDNETVKVKPKGKASKN